MHKSIVFPIAVALLCVPGPVRAQTPNPSPNVVNISIANSGQTVSVKVGQKVSAALVVPAQPNNLWQYQLSTTGVLVGPPADVTLPVANGIVGAYIQTFVFSAVKAGTVTIQFAQMPANGGAAISTFNVTIVVS